MLNNERNIKITKKIELGENKKYDDAIANLFKSFPPKIATKLGELFLLEDFERMNVDTFIINVEGVLSFFKQRNRGVSKKDEAYVSEEDIINLIKRYPRILSQNTADLLSRGASILDNLKDMNAKTVNSILKNSSGYIYSIGDEKIYKTLNFLDELTVITDDGKQQTVSQYLLTVLGESNLQMGTEKVFQRLLNIVTAVGTKTIPEEEIKFCFKRNDDEYEKRYGKSKKQLDEMYVLPRTDDREQYKQQIQYIVERQANGKNKQKGEE